MASSTDSPASKNKYDQYLDERIAQTVQQVKWVELLSFFLLLAVFLLGALFLLCLIDAWVIQLSVTMRWLSLIVLGGGSLAYTVYKAFPFFLHRVNPLYAAKKLEEGRPELKNSVINYLTTETDPKRKSAASIQKKLSQKAATDVANIPLDVTVDRTPMIVAGYTLAAIVAVFALYKIWSPKDPFQTIGRVILPSAELMAPARVKISDVTPGDAQKYFGETIEISARIKGLKEGEFAQILMTSESSTQKGLAQALNREGDSDQFKIVIGENGGLRESFSYQIKAGDATSIAYQVEVRTCPTIFLENVEYQPPAYTGIPVRVEENPESISGVEGAIAKITARSNMPIETAYLKLFRAELNEQGSAKEDSGDAETEREKSTWKVAKSVKLDIEDSFKATGEFLLELNAKRNDGRFSHYQIVFTTTEGDKSESPTYSRLQVIPDLSPEVKIIAPVDRVVEVPEDQIEKIELSAVDPDYGLTSITIVAEQKGNRLFEEFVFKSKDQVGVKGAQQASFGFRPDQFGLKAGDEVVWFAAAEDNRAVGKNQMLVPNRFRSKNYKFLITPAITSGSPGNSEPDKDPNQEENPKEQPEKQKDDPNQNPKKQPNQQQQKGKQGGSQKQKKDSEPDPNDKNQKGNSDQKKQGKSEPQKGSQSENRSQPEKKEASKSSEPQNSKQKSSGQKQSGKQDPSKGKSGSGKQGEPQKNNDPQQGTGKGKSSGRKQPSDTNSNQSSGPQQGKAGQDSNSKPGNQPKTGSNDNGKGGGQKQTTNERVGDSESPENSLARSENDQPNDSDSQSKPQNSKEAFERLKDYFERKEKENSKQLDDSNQQDKSTGSQENQTEEPKRNPGNSSEKKDVDKSKKETPGKQEKGAGKKSAQNQGAGEKRSVPKKGDSNSGEKKPKKRDGTGEKSKDSNELKNGFGKSGKENSGSQKKKAKESKSADSSKQSNRPNNGKSGNQKSDPKSGQKGSQKGAEQKNSKNPKNSDANKKGNAKSAESKSQDAEKQDPNKRAKNQKSNGKSKSADDNRAKQDSGGDSGDANQSSSKSKQDLSDSKSRSNSGKNRRETQAEKANLAYTKKATEMVLEKLSEQKDRPDEDLLKDLKWTEEELREFNQKWQAMREKAQQGNAKDKTRFEEALKSLGLKDPNLKLQDADLRNDDKTGYQQKSRTRNVPSDFARKFRAIQKSQQSLDKNE